MKFLKNILILFILAIAAWWLLGKLNLLPSFGKIFASKEVVIDDTPVIVQQIRPLAQLVTITAYTEVTADTTMPASTGEKIRDILNPFSFDVAMNRQLIITGGAVVHVGVDLQKLKEEDIFISGDSIRVQLPEASILDVIVNPSATAVFLEEGNWDNDAVVNLKKRIQAKAVAEIKSRGLLYQAEERAREVLQNFFLATGYKNVAIVKSRLG